MKILGFDIGGTKCAVIAAEWNGTDITLIEKKVCPTDLGIAPEKMIGRMTEMADSILDFAPDAVGISCGGPLDDKKGIIMSPPNLPGWDDVHIVEMLEARYGVPVKLCNDANAGAVAEWKFGAGRGCSNMVFLTFGTGMGAGLIIDGSLYSGTNGNAGEVGHLRLEKDGPTGYGKAGSFEGFCSGQGIAQLGKLKAIEYKARGITPLYCRDENAAISAKTIAEAALAGDEAAIEVYRLSGEYLGYGLSLIIDILNPEKIVIGSVFARNGALMTDRMNEIIKNEALSPSASCCEVVAAELGENIGDYAAVATALI